MYEGRNQSSMGRRRPVLLTLAGLTAAVALAPLPAQAGLRPNEPGEPATDGTVVVEWNEIAMRELVAAGRHPLTQPFVVAAMQIAVYDAVVAIERGAEPFLTELSAPHGASSPAAAAAAAHGVLKGYLPGSAQMLDTELAETLAGIPDGLGETDGVLVGEAAAAATVADRQNDGTQSGPTPPPNPPGPGVWAPTPPATVGMTPWLADARPFALRSTDQVRPPAPPALGSPEYERDLDEVRRFGAAAPFSTERTAEQTAIARFWSDQPINQTYRTLRGHAAKLGWDIGATARLFAAVTTSQADALLACWDAKYHYQLWRPWQSVPVVEPGWTPLLATPNHPEFPSAHGCLTGSLGYSLTRLMGTNRIDLDVDAVVTGTTRHFATRDDLLEELGNARVWGGLHYRFSTEAGLWIAKRVVNFNLSHNFHTVPG